MHYSSAAHYFTHDKNSQISVIITITRHIVCRFLADIVIGYLMDQAATAAWISHAQNNPHMKALQPPSMALSQPSQVKASRNLPDPLFPGNFGNYSSQCILDEAIQVRQPLSCKSHALEVASLSLLELPAMQNDERQRSVWGIA